VALTLLPEALDTDFTARFRRESHVAARLREPHVVPIHDYGEIDGRLDLDTRLVDGRNLSQVLREDGPLTPARTVALLGQVAEALEAAHSDGLVHRDIEPGNVLVTPGDVVHVVDFGVARSIGSTRTSLTITGATVGTPDHMAPERFTDQPLDGRVDVHSLACVLAQCLTCRRPFSGEDLPSLLYAHLYADPPRPSELAPGIPRSSTTWWRAGRPSARRTATPRPARWSGRPPRPWPVLVLVAGGLTWWLWPDAADGGGAAGPSAAQGTTGAPTSSAPPPTRLHRRRPHGRYPSTTHREEGVVSVLDTTSLQVVSSNPIDVGPPRSVTFSPDGSRAYVTVLDEAAVRVHDLAA
jgi:serine/threonine-protein kinase